MPGGFIPDEDKGYLFVAVQLPEGASLQRTDEVMKQVEEIVTKTPGARSGLAIVGLNILNSLNFPNTAMMFVGLVLTEMINVSETTELVTLPPRLPTITV